MVNASNAVWNRLVALCGMVLLCSGLVNGQQQPKIQFDVEKGLPSNNVYRVMEDSKGYIWFPTDAGVARFDGNTFEVFTREDGLTNNDVLSIDEDSRGRVWFLTLAGGLCYYENGEIWHPGNDPLLKQGPRRSFLAHMFEDSQHRLWFTTRSEGVYCLDGDAILHFALDFDPLNYGAGGIWEEDEKIFVRVYDGDLPDLPGNEGRSLPRFWIFSPIRHDQHAALQRGRRL